MDILIDPYRYPRFVSWTSKPYPAEMIDSVDVSFRITSATMAEFEPILSMDVNFSVLPSSLTQVFFPAFLTAPVESADITSFAVIGGALETTFFPKYLSAPTESADITSFAVIGGALEETFFPIYYAYSESLDVGSFAIIGGDLS